MVTVMERNREAEGLRAVGIDLGTTHSCVGVWLPSENRVHIIANADSRLTPSYVTFPAANKASNGGDITELVGNAPIVGSWAREEGARIDPRNTVYASKRLLGRKFTDQVVQNDIKHWPFKVVSNRMGDPFFQVNYKGETRNFSPEEVSGMILQKLKDSAESFLGGMVTEAVITVPAHFNSRQRRATEDAAALAGLQVMRIINEPTAAAVAYGLEWIHEKTEQYLLCFDLGGGTFDVSLVVIDSGIIEVKATAGDTHLGGEDFDNRLVDYVKSEFKRRHGRELAYNPRALRRLKNACERAKRELSMFPSAQIELEDLLQGMDLYLTITRQQFEDLIADLIRSTLNLVATVLHDAAISVNEVHRLVLAGGSTRIPCLQRMLSSYFNGKQPCQVIDVDEAVATGAAVQAAILHGHFPSRCVLRDMLLIDVQPLSLGVQVLNGSVQVILPRNATLPCFRAGIFTTAHDFQDSLMLCVYEGHLAQDNAHLATFEFNGITPALKGLPRVVVRFDLDAGGQLLVLVTDSSNARTERFSLQDVSKKLHPPAESSHGKEPVFVSLYSGAEK